MLRRLAHVESAAASPWWSSGWFVVLLAVVSVLGVAGTFWFGLKPRATRSRLKYVVENSALVGPGATDHGVEVTVDGMTLSRATMSVISIVNAGPVSVRGSDLVATVPSASVGLHIQFAGELPATGQEGPRTHTVARATLHGSSAPYIGPTLEADLTGVRLGFELLEPGDSFSVALIHDGEPSMSIDLVGHVAGGELIKFTGGGFGDLAASVAIEVARSAFPFGGLAGALLGLATRAQSDHADGR